MIRSVAALCCLFGLTTAVRCFAAEYFVNDANYEAAIAAARPGDVITFQNGTYDDLHIAFKPPQHGTKASRPPRSSLIQLYKSVGPETGRWPRPSASCLAVDGATLPD